MYTGSSTCRKARRRMIRWRKKVRRFSHVAYIYDGKADMTAGLER